MSDIYPQESARNAFFNSLQSCARELGASKTALIPTAKIRADRKYARYCEEEPGCPFFGLSSNCSSATGKPSVFKALVKQCSTALIIRIDLPSNILFSSQRLEIMALLHEIVATLEHKAQDQGYTCSQGLAGGSCKELFCHDYPECRKLVSEKGCRNPDKARPSMSRFGIDVNHLMQVAGWSGCDIGKRSKTDDPEGDRNISWVAALLFIG